MSDEPNPSDILYHYCSNAAFLSIVENDSIRLSDLSLSNDSQEGRWVRKVFEEYCTAHGVARDHLDVALRCLDEIIDITRAFGFCVSGDHDSLSQWRAYADNGSGVAIGLSTEYLKYSSRPDLAPLLQGAGFERVRYKKDEQHQLISPAADKILNFIATNEDNSNPAEMAQLIVQRIFISISDIWLVHFFIKNHKFFEENEYRTLIQYFDPSGREDSLSGIFQHHVSGNGIVPYLAVRLCHNGESPIRKVVLGPRNSTPKYVIEGFLAKHGHEDVEVVLSDASYR